jgi:tetratricopeptide (TPR) repeat protein
VAAEESPLIAYAQEIRESDSRSELKGEYATAAALRAVNFEMSRHPPPRDEDCARTLGAQRFAEQYAQLAALEEERGNFEAMIQANESAIACAPRVGSYHASIASAHLSLGRISEARDDIERANTLDPDDVDIRNVRARVDFLQERWADATARFRLDTLERTRYDRYADYSRCYLWLAQRRAGVRNPELPPTEPGKRSPADAPYNTAEWPNPILETLQGKLSEADLVKRIRENRSSAPRQWLTEALFYVGELRLAEGDAESARRLFATVINLRVLNFVEYGMARAEIHKMREHEPVADAATPGTETQRR